MRPLLSSQAECSVTSLPGTGPGLALHARRSAVGLPPLDDVASCDTTLGGRSVSLHHEPSAAAGSPAFWGEESVESPDHHAKYNRHDESKGDDDAAARNRLIRIGSQLRPDDIFTARRQTVAVPPSHASSDRGEYSEDGDHLRSSVDRATPGSPPVDGENIAEDLPLVDNAASVASLDLRRRPRLAGLDRDDPGAVFDEVDAKVWVYLQLAQAEARPLRAAFRRWEEFVRGRRALDGRCSGEEGVAADDPHALQRPVASPKEVVSADGVATDAVVGDLVSRSQQDEPRAAGTYRASSSDVIAASNGPREEVPSSLPSNSCGSGPRREGMERINRKPRPLLAHGESGRRPQKRGGSGRNPQDHVQVAVGEPVPARKPRRDKQRHSASPKIPASPHPRVDTLVARDSSRVARRRATAHARCGDRSSSDEEPARARHIEPLPLPEPNDRDELARRRSGFHVDAFDSGPGRWKHAQRRHFVGGAAGGASNVSLH